MFEIFVILAFASLCWCVAMVTMRPMDEFPVLAKHVLALVAATGGGVFGFLLLWLAKSTRSGPTREQEQRYKPRPVQVVGQNCAACSERILLVTDGHICSICGQVYCRDCEAELPCSKCMG